MAVQIEEINVRNLGPIDDLQLKLGLFNLIYGKNETGKTYLVEFILQSLFKSTKKWSLRETAANGKILVAGLNECLIEFSPTSRKKIDDYWKSVREGIPVNMEKLLVVRGAELNLTDYTPGGVDRTIIREFLSSKAILDDIQDRISKTLQKSVIADCSIEGSRAGEIKRWYELQDELETIDVLFRDIDSFYSVGYRAELEKSLKSVQKGIEKQNFAKRHLAFEIEKEISELNTDKGQLSDEVLKELRDLNKEYKIAKSRKVQKESEIETLRKASDDYEWLKRAIEHYILKVGEFRIQEPKIFLILAAFLLFFSLVLQGAVWSGWIDQVLGFILSGIGVLLAAVMGFLHIRSQSQLLKKSFDYFEGQQIAAEFERHFEEELTNLPAMEALKDLLQEDYFRKKGLEGDAREEGENLEKTRITMLDSLSQFNGDVEQDGPWDSAIQALEEKLREIEESKQQREKELASLNIELIDYLEEDPGQNYRKDLLGDLIRQKERLEAELRDEQTKLDTLKQKICQETKDEISVPWEELLENLKLRRIEKASEYKTLIAGILAKILINEELDLLRKQEDIKIQDTLTSEIISKPLHQITGRYEGIGLYGDRLFVSDPYSTFPVSELSTGAQEQVLLALRIGCASKIMGKDCLFLILDDAFQHADWDRREWMLDEVVNLSKMGWQILYLTMDDHLRDLFQGMGKKLFRDDFVFFEIASTA
jgi:hypothetical protein